MSRFRKNGCLERSLTILFVGLLLGLMTGAAVTLLLPKNYRATATIQVREPQTTEVRNALILSKEVLHPVIDRLKLSERWGTKGREEAFSRLRQGLRIREIRNTELIQISAADSDPKLAAEIANAVAQEYQRNRVEQQQVELANVLRQLQDEVERQRGKVEKLRAEVGKIRLEEGVTDFWIIFHPTKVEEAVKRSKQKLKEWKASGLGPEHPEIMATEAEVRALEDAIAAGNLPLSAQGIPVRYREAKENYLKARKVLETIEMRLSTESMQRMMPRHPVNIWERAEPSEHPPPQASP